MRMAAGYLLVINVVALVAYGLDKRKAKKGAWRTPEKTLLLLAAVGGAWGAWMGMKVFRHKTQHWKFRILVPLLALAWAAGIVWMLWRGYL